MRLFLCVLVFAAALRGLPASADVYAVGVNDELSLRVQQWLPVEGEIREWEAMTGNYVVGADGMISVPFLGPVQAAGRTRPEIGEEISEKLKQRFALSVAPDATIEVVRYRPVYVAGLVRSGGEYPFAPGLTVQQAVSLAGGLSDELRRTSSLMRDLIQAEGSLRIFESQHTRLLVKKARLDAEIDGREEIGNIGGIENAPLLEAIVLDETLILNARRERVARSLEGFDRQKELLSAEIEALEQKQESLERQRELSEEGLENAQSLAQRGLAANARVLDSERLLASIEGQLLDISTAILRARQGIATAEQDRSAVLDTFKSDLAVERQRVDAELEEIGQRVEMQRLLALDAARLVEPAYAGTAGLLPDPEYTILRVVDGEMEEIAAEGATILRPGDVIEVGLGSLAVQ